MAIVVSKSSGLNDGFWKVTATQLSAVLKEADQEKNDYDQLVKDIALVKTSKKFAEKQSSVTALPSFEIVAEGADAPLADFQEGTPKLIVHNTFEQMVKITKELIDDGDIDIAAVKAKNLVKAYKRTRAEFLTKYLTSEGTTFTYGKKAGLDRTTGDGKALFATDHASVLDDVADQSNVFTNAFSLQALVKLANIGRNFKTEGGYVSGYNFNKIIIPGDRPELEEQIKKIIGSDLEPGTPNNDLNTQKGKWKLVVDPLWSAGDAAIAPYILMSDECNVETNGLCFYDRTVLDVMMQENINNRNLETSGYARMGVGCNNWRSVILGGAALGTTLSF